MSIDVTGFSFSAISTFNSCPRGYKYKYMEKIPEAFSSIEAHMGSSVHEALEWAYAQKKEGYNPTLEMALEQYKYSWNSGNFETIKIVKKDISKEDYFQQGIEFISSFFQRVFTLDQSTTIYLEQKFELPLGEKIIYRGIIDRIAREPDGILQIIDYKTGRVGHPLDTLQLPSYALYIFQHNIDPEIRLCFEDLREKRTVIAPFTRKQTGEVKEKLLTEIEKIRNTSDDNFITMPSILCLWCGYNTICPNPHEAVKRVDNQDTTAKVSKKKYVNTNKDENKNGEFLEACPSCGGQLQKRNGKFGPFLGCRNFPQCRYTLDINDDKSNPAQNPEVDGKDICPECGSLLKQRKGKYGDFMGCSNYPECRFTRDLTAT